MKQQYLALLTAMSMLAGYHTSAQSSEARVNAGEDRVLCNTSCFNLTANISDIKGTENYIVDSSVDFNSHYPFYIPGSGSVPAQNNMFSGAIRLPFSFCFYGKAYSSVAIGSNGIISFDNESVGKRCEPVTKKEIPSRAYAYAAIMPAYQALDLSMGGSIYYATDGNAPNRKFIVNYNNIPVRGCSADNATFQVVLYETSNIIEIYIKDKPSCIYYHDGAAIAGIQDRHKDGIALPGKNASRWGSAGMNAAYRFIPWGEVGTQMVQLTTMSGEIIKSVEAGASENGQLSAYFGDVCINEKTAQYLVSTTYNNCGLAYTVDDTLNISTDPGCSQAQDNYTPAETMIDDAPIENEPVSVKNDMPPSPREINLGRVMLVNPTVCLGINGSISLHGLFANKEYTVQYSKNGMAQKSAQIRTNAAGALIISRLSAGTYSDIKVINEGSTASEAGPFVLTDPELPATPIPVNNGPANPGEKIALSVANPDRVSYTWLGPGFAVVNPSPTILNAQPYNAGTYTVVATRNGCNSRQATTIVAVTGKGGVPNRMVPVRNTMPQPANTITRNPAVAAAPRQKPPPAGRLAANVQQPLKATASSNSPVPAGGTLHLHTAAISGATYSWNGPNDFSSDAQNPALNDVDERAAGIYTITVASPQGVLRTTHVKVNVAGSKGVDAVSKAKDTRIIEEQLPVIHNIMANPTDPCVKYGSDGVIALSGLAPSTTYKVFYRKNGLRQPMRYATTDAKGVLLVMWLTAGNYDDIYVATKDGRSNSVSAVLSNPGATVSKPATVTKPSAVRAPRIEERRTAEAATPRLTVKQSQRAPVADLKPKPQATKEKAVVEEASVGEYKGIILSDALVELGGKVTVNYTDKIREPKKVKWDFGDAVVESGSGNGPYVLHWKTTGEKIVSLRLPFRVGSSFPPCKDEFSLCRRINVVEPAGNAFIEEQQPAAPSLSEKIKARHEAEDNVMAPQRTEGLVNTESAREVEAAREIESQTDLQSSIAARHEAEDIAAQETPSETLQSSIAARHEAEDIAVQETPSQPDLRSAIAARHEAEDIAVQETPSQPDLRSSIAARHADDNNSEPAMKQTQTVPRASEKITTADIKRRLRELQTNELEINKRNVCLNDDVAISVSGAVAEDAELKWDFDGGNIISGSGAGPYMVRWDEPGSKTISLNISGSAAKSNFTSSVNVKTAPTADFSMQDDACPGEKVFVGTAAKYRNERCTWDFDGADILSGDDGGPYEVKWEEPGKKVVSVTIVDEAGCTSLPYREIITIHEDCCNVGVPNAFTPNGDGKNDVFHVVSAGPHMIVRFVIRNRFGREIFSTNNEDAGWDGTLGGVPQEIGTYYYQVRYRCGQTLHEKDGEVMLLR